MASGSDTPTPTNDLSTIPLIFQLPDEILHEICRHCLQSDWICLSLVCKRFRVLAATQLYRNFHIVFPDEDDPCFDSPIDGLAGGLDSFTTSDYDYAKHLRDLSLDTLSVGDKAEAAYKPYLTSLSCGKFMNTLLLLTLRKAKALDRFRWNIRVELTRPIYKALHNIESLRHLHIRLQAGPSALYDEMPLPLPYLASEYPVYPASPPMTVWVNSAGTPLVPVVPSGAGSFPVSMSSQPTYKPWKNRLSKKPSAATKDPVTIAGFKALQTLAILDIDNLDIITEIKACIRNSASTLRKLKLSFSDALAMQARTPSLDAEADESEDEEFQVVPLTTTVNYDSNGPAKVFRAQEERKAQESALGRIFEVEPFRTKIHRASSRSRKGKEKETKEQLPSSEAERFIHDVDRVFQRMAAHVNGTNDLSILDQQGTLDAIGKAARKYVDSETAKAAATPSSKNQGESNETPAVTKEGEPSSISGDSFDEKVLTPATEETQVERQPKARNVDEGMAPEDIDITIPEEQLGVDDEPSTYMTAVGPAKVSIHSPLASLRNRTAQHHNIRRLDRIMRQCEQDADALFKEIREADKLDDDDAEKRLTEARERLESIHRDVTNIQQEMNVVKAEMVDADEQLAPIDDEKQEQRRANVNEYTRSTRGIALHSLSLHLIPIRPSVLGKALDLHTLKRITLLNVGEQRKFWALMMRENSLKPLPLRKVFTDDVCLPFLQLVSELSCVQEVFMLQRSSKYKPESFAANPGTTIEQIRKFVLRKHLPTLRRLMIKNNADKSWDVDDKTIQLICRRGKALEELAVAMGMRAFHTLIQSIAGLVNLRALQLIAFRTDDTCVSVVREARRFIVDAISHHPELKLEWLAISEDDRAMRIARKPDPPKKSKNNKGANGKGKGKEVAFAAPTTTTVTGGSSSHTNPNTNAGSSSSHGFNNTTTTTTIATAGGGTNFPVFNVDTWDAASDSEDDDYGDEVPGSRLELIEGFAFYDVYGIRIFKKEVATGRL
ncbi:hypothetical protein F5B20DRAFT_565986 [Whalleya microplaca]|nr:hypothetical protein F5B20DRAFT_565986 [Whalleya microplaca]